MSFGSRQPKELKGKQKIRELETSLANIEMATRISQMMLKQVLEQFKSLRLDVDNTMGVLNDFQYRTQAMMKLGNFDISELNKLAEEFKLKDYMSASDGEDLIKGYANDDAGVVGEDSVVIITSATNGDEDKGIFRSKFAMAECKTESLRASLLGKTVGDTFEEQINGDTHKITIVGLRKITNKEGETVNDGEANQSN